MPNPIVQTITLNNATQASGILSCVTNAGFTQKVAVKIVDKNNKTVIDGYFQGKGEQNTPAPWSGGGTSVHFQGQATPLTVTITASYDPNGTFQNNDPNKVKVSTQQFGTLETIMVTSEDWVDNDFNDSILNAAFVGH